MKIDCKNNVFLFPAILSPEVHFPSFAKDYLANYIQYLKDLGYLEDTVFKVEQFAYNINVCLNEYYCGQHNSAQYFFRRALNNIDFKDIYRSVSSNTFYRARKSSKSVLLPTEMFHIPFQDRYKVKTQRYSYPGLPCLYLGSSIDVCCEELGCWDPNLNIAQVRKIAPREIVVFDLFFFEEYDFENLSPEEEECFVRLWPLVACCSFAYKDTSDMSFRPDYIIPQLLLEHIIDKNAEKGIAGSDNILHGIRYHSVKKAPFQDCSKSSTSSYINYVFPVFSNEVSGYCDTLEKLFCVDTVFMLSEKENYLSKTP